MNVVAVSTPHQPGWRWRIVNYGGEIVEESSSGFATIAQAVAEGTQHLRRQEDRDLAARPSSASPWRRHQ